MKNSRILPTQKNYILKSVYKSRLAHVVVVDTNPALKSAAVLKDPIKCGHAKTLSSRYLSPHVGKRMSSANFRNT